MMRIEDINITQESVEEFFNEIDTEALADSIRMSISAHKHIDISAKKTYYAPSNKRIFYTLKNIDTTFDDMGVAA